MPGIPKAIQGRVTVLLETDVMSFGFIIHSGLAAKEAKLQIFVLYLIYNVSGTFRSLNLEECIIDAADD